ncbi:MAG: branched-chain amino acid aminotransferase [Patescibacteria group bacterium]|nr:branched-chain amino acid aminotransferase [Patescibacteria group bacterium]
MKNDKPSRINTVDFTNLPFGKIFTDHMVITRYSDKKWSDSEVVPYGPLELMPSISALHYGQTVFEGMKAFLSKDGSSTIYRPDAHSKRINKSLARLDMPELPEAVFMDSLQKLINTDAEWLKKAGQLYLRPFIFATDPYLGVKSSEQYIYALLACPVGPYYTKPLNLKVETTYSRSASGGVGFAKAAGNYAGSLYPTRLAQEAGFDQLIWTDSSTHSYIEESGTMNIMSIIDGTLVTPELSETILAGITRDSVLTLAREMGIKVEERKLKVAEIVDGLKSGKVTEVFGAGTAATIIRFASITEGENKFTLPDLGEKSIAQKIYDELNMIKKGEKADTHGWLKVIV